MQLFKFAWRMTLLGPAALAQTPQSLRSRPFRGEGLAEFYDAIETIPLSFRPLIASP